MRKASERQQTAIAQSKTVPTLPGSCPTAGEDEAHLAVAPLEEWRTGWSWWPVRCGVIKVFLDTALQQLHVHSSPGMHQTLTRRSPYLKPERAEHVQELKQHARA